MCFTGDHVFHDVLLDGTFFYDHLYVFINKSFPRIALKAKRRQKDVGFTFIPSNESSWGRENLVKT